MEIVKIAKACHRSVKDDTGSDPSNREELELAGVVYDMWGITAEEQRHVSQYYADILTFRTKRSEAIN